jgi:hypothetical protein
MKKNTLDAKHEEILRGQAIDASRPGPLLHDFALVLDYVGEAGVKAGGKYNLLPIEAIPALDPKLARPLNLDMKRPQLRSHPYLQGLHLLLRSTGLVRVESQGKAARLVVVPEVKRSWDGLNDVERYFALLEAWLIVSRAAMVGETRSWQTSLLVEFTLMASALGERRGRGVNALPFGLLRDTYQLALLDLFGWLRIEGSLANVSRDRNELRSLTLTPFGEAMLLLLGMLDQDDDSVADLMSDEPSERQAFGALRPLFRPYFPAWQNDLELPSAPPAGEGVFVWRLTLAGRKAWRLIALRHDHTLDDLLYAILRSIGFDSDHLYEFRYRDAMGREAVAVDPRCDDGRPADEVTLGSLPLKVGESLKLTYDFGDNWRFDVKLERIDPPGSVKKLPAVLESQGKAPEQYPSWDE